MVIDNATRYDENRIVREFVSEGMELLWLGFDDKQCPWT
jgi:hypothetical protein